MRWSKRIAGFPAFASIAISGCRAPHDMFGADEHADILHGAIPAPLSTYSCQWQQAQNGLAE